MTGKSGVALSSLDEAVEERRMEIIREAVDEATHAFYTHLEERFQVNPERLTDHLDLQLHDAAERWFSRHHEGFLNVMLLGQAITSLLPSGLARLVMIDKPNSDLPTLDLHLGDLQGMFWRIYPDDESLHWVMMLHDEASNPLLPAPLELSNVPLTTPRHKAVEVASQLLDEIGWPRYIQPKVDDEVMAPHAGMLMLGGGDRLLSPAEQG